MGDHLTQETAFRHTKFHAPGRAKLDVYAVGDFTVNWAFLFLRIAIGLSILTLLFLSQRFWYRSLWRMTSNWGQIWLRVGQW